MQILLPCDDMFLRSAATQRPNYAVSRHERLSSILEKELTQLFDRYLN